jgi:hypothetical protein
VVLSTATPNTGRCATIRIPILIAHFEHRSVCYDSNRANRGGGIGGGGAYGNNYGNNANAAGNRDGNAATHDGSGNNANQEAEAQITVRANPLTMVRRTAALVW